MNKTQSSYLSYLLRLRRVDNAGRPVWRASLETPGSATQIYFDNLETLWAYLAKQMQTLDEKGGIQDKTKRETKT
jgi:hypothetical protein